jgi:tetratricopeptide (TPR) repeat protein
MTTERNAPCPCGSGKKFKECCGRIVQAAPAIAQEDPQQALLALFAAQRYAELEQAARTQIAAGVNTGFIWKALGVALKMQGKDARGAMHRAADLSPNDAEAHFNLGNAQKDAGDYAAAAESYRRALALRPDFALAHNNLGLALFAQGIHDAALASFDMATQYGGATVGSHLNIGNVLMKIGEYETAERSYRQALQVDGQFIDAQHGVALALRKQGQSTAALIECRKTLTAAPRHAEAAALLAALLADQGDFTAARQAYQQAISFDARNVHAWAGLAQIGKMTTDDQDWLLGVRTLIDSGLPPASAVPLRFAIGKFFDDTGDYEHAFANYRSANELLKACTPRYQAELQTTFTDKLIATFDRDWFSAKRNASDSTRPLFIIGMPRSGTSLVEQVLAAHPDVVGAGELAFWGNAIQRHTAASLLGGEGNRIIGELAQEYLQLLQRFSNDAKHVIDKMPSNFLMLGLIHAAFPHARFIHVRRDPVDTALSIYFQYFDEAHAYAHDLHDIAHFTGEYRRLMQHWRTLLPTGTMLELQYEDLVGDYEAQARSLIDFAGLPWDVRCLDATQQQRTVTTASNWQVRQKVNSNAVGRWRRYSAHIAPLMALQSADA